MDPILQTIFIEETYNLLFVQLLFLAICWPPVFQRPSADNLLSIAFALFHDFYGKGIAKNKAEGGEKQHLQGLGAQIFWVYCDQNTTCLFRLRQC